MNNLAAAIVFVILVWVIYIVMEERHKDRLK